MLWWLLASAWGQSDGVDLYYETVSFRVGVPPAVLARGVLAKKLRSEHIELWLESQDGTRSKLSGRSRLLSESMAQAVLVPIYLERIGAEFDFVAERGDGWLLLCTVRWESRHEIVVSRGKHPSGLHHDGPPAATIIERWGIGELVSVDRPVDPLTLGLIDAALEAMSAEDRALVAGLPIHRRAEPEYVAEEPTSARYVGSADVPHIEVFDVAFTPRPNFVGEPWDARPYPLKTMVHELGHALAAAPDRARAAAISALEQRHTTATEARRELAAKELVGAAAEAQARRLEALEAQVEDLEAALHVLSERPSTPPVLAAYREAVGDELAPTQYGRRSDTEGFAEAYGLFHVDRRALARVSPRAEAWLAAGGHTEAARAAVQAIEEVVGE